jgi:hypothetical protein
MCAFWKPHLRLILAFGFAWSPLSHAIKTSFDKPNAGILFGAGTYWYPSPTDPVPLMLPAGTQIQGASNYYFVPGKMGFWMDLPGHGLFVELFGRYAISTPVTWTVGPGSLNGSGNTSRTGYGGGLNLGATVAKASWIRLRLFGATDYLQHTIKANYKEAGMPLEEIKLSGGGLSYGGGARVEIWTISTWIVGLSTQYHGGSAFQWSAAKSGNLFGVKQSGSLKNPKTGNSIATKTEGWFGEVDLRLAFP